jgi:hypothetical protein
MSVTFAGLVGFGLSIYSCEQGRRKGKLNRAKVCEAMKQADKGELKYTV